MVASTPGKRFEDLDRDDAGVGRAAGGANQGAAHSQLLDESHQLRSGQVRSPSGHLLWFRRDKQRCMVRN